MIRKFTSITLALLHSVETGELATVEIAKDRVKNADELHERIAAATPVKGRTIVDLGGGAFDASGTLDDLHPVAIRGKSWSLHVVWERPQ